MRSSNERSWSTQRSSETTGSSRHIPLTYGTAPECWCSVASTPRRRADAGRWACETDQLERSPAACAGLARGRSGCSVAYRRAATAVVGVLRSATSSRAGHRVVRERLCAVRVGNAPGRRAAWLARLRRLHGRAAPADADVSSLRRTRKARRTAARAARWTRTTDRGHRPSAAGPRRVAVLPRVRSEPVRRAGGGAPDAFRQRLRGTRGAVRGAARASSHGRDLGARATLAAPSARLLPVGGALVRCARRRDRATAPVPPGGLAGSAPAGGERVLAHRSGAGQSRGRPGGDLGWATGAVGDPADLYLRSVLGRDLWGAEHPAQPGTARAGRGPRRDVAARSRRRGHAARAGRAVWHPGLAAAGPDRDVPAGAVPAAARLRHPAGAGDSGRERAARGMHGARAMAKHGKRLPAIVFRKALSPIDAGVALASAATCRGPAAGSRGAGRERHRPRGGRRGFVGAARLAIADLSLHHRPRHGGGLAGRADPARRGGA